VRDKVLSIVRQRYADFGPTLAQEKLVELHKLAPSVETLRKWMITEELWVPRKQRVGRPHQPRHRRTCRGELVQLDGSLHHWFEDRGKRCTLLVFVDDATSGIMGLHFCKEESANSYFVAMKRYLEQHGKPVALYGDRSSIFRVNGDRGGGGIGLTQFGMGLQTLEIGMICANSPQAKGRVERANGTLQDRLIKEMRLQGISTMEAANAWTGHFIEDYNRRFSVPPLSENDLHRPLQPDEDLSRALCHKTRRKVSKNLTFNYDAKLWLLEDTQHARSSIGTRVGIEEQPGGAISIWHRKRQLKAKVLAHRSFASGQVVPRRELDSMLRRVQAEQRRIARAQ
jgi:hypothetical protein